MNAEFLDWAGGSCTLSSRVWWPAPCAWKAPEKPCKGLFCNTVRIILISASKITTGQAITTVAHPRPPSRLKRKISRVSIAGPLAKAPAPPPG